MADQDAERSLSASAGFQSGRWAAPICCESNELPILLPGQLFGLEDHEALRQRTLRGGQSEQFGAELAKDGVESEEDDGD